MTRKLEGSYAKIDRAIEHFNALHPEIKEWCESHPYVMIEDHDQQTGWHRLLRRDPLRDPPPEWSVIVGEIMHNLRSALDQLAWQLALSATDHPDDRLQFPSFSKSFLYPDTALAKKRGWKGGCAVKGKERKATWARHFAGVDVTHVQMLKALQPYRRRRRFNFIPLEELVTFNDSDKHRLLIDAVLVAVPDPVIGPILRDVRLAPGARIVERRVPPGPTVPINQAEILAFRVEPPDAAVEMDVNDRVPVSITIGGTWFSYLSIEFLILDVMRIVGYFERAIDPAIARRPGARPVLATDFSTAPIGFVL